MVRTDWQAVAKVFDEAAMEVSLATNGTLITDEVARFLAGLKKVSLSISIDGDEEIHDSAPRSEGQAPSHHARTQGSQECGRCF